LRHVQRYLGLVDGLASIIGVSANADLADPLSGEKVQESAFELLATHTLMDVETTVLAACKRVLTDSGAGGRDESWLEAVASSVAGTVGSTVGLTPSPPAGGGPSTSSVLRARGEAILLLSVTYASAKSTNPDPYSWREAFAAAASGASR